MKNRIPKFRSLEDERRFWDTHSIVDFVGELKPARVSFARPRKKLVSIRLDSQQIGVLREIASHKGLGYLSLIRSWITERLSKEPHFNHAHHN